MRTLIAVGAGVGQIGLPLLGLTMVGLPYAPQVTFLGWFLCTLTVFYVVFKEG